MHEVSPRFAAVVIDHSQALRFALDIARGMNYLHTLDPLLMRLVSEAV